MSGLSTIYGSDKVGNAILWGTSLGSNATTVGGDDQPPAYSAEDEESGVEMTSLLGTPPPFPVQFTFGSHLTPKDQLINDMNESDVDIDMSGGVVIPTHQEDEESVEIRVDDEDTITPAADDKDTTTPAADDKGKGGMVL